MRLFYINKYSIKEDIKCHIKDNRGFYIFGIILFLVCMFFGIRAGIRALNPHTALAHYNINYFNLVNVIGRDKYTISCVLTNLLSIFLIYVATLHYFTTPLCVIVLIQRIFNFAVTLSLLFRIFSFGAILVSLIALIPFFILLISILLNFCVYMYRSAQYCFRYGHSSFVLFCFRSMWKRLAAYVIITIVVAAVGGGLTVLLTSSII